MRLDNHLRTLLQPSRPSPSAGSATVDKVVDDDDDKGKWNALRNVLYYSPSYLGYDENVRNIKGSFYTGSSTKDWAIAHIAQSWIYAGRPDSLPVWGGGTAASELGDIWDKARNLASKITLRKNSPPHNYLLLVVIFDIILTSNENETVEISTVSRLFYYSNSLNYFCIVLKPIDFIGFNSSLLNALNHLNVFRRVQCVKNASL